MTDQQQIAYYTALLAKHGDHYHSLDWKGTNSQDERFSILREIFLYGNKSVNLSLLDVGCGFGDLYGYLKKHKLLDQYRLHYTGYDIAPSLLEVAGKKYPAAKFQLCDILEEIKVPTFDYVFCSGTLNLRLTDLESHQTFVRAMLTRMFELANYGLAVNFLSAGGASDARIMEQNLGRYFYFKPEEIISFCRYLTSDFILRHDYYPGDFTVYLMK
ncbi:class I SAM-dependent methyltransferase [Candidatus Saganbacteria bacterium]|nr:class I SAM-dependent methyltransferase [Candidatus Saganbacteria bacterium]